MFFFVKMSLKETTWKVALLSLYLIAALDSSDPLYFKPKAVSKTKVQNDFEFRLQHSKTESLTHNELGQTCGPMYQYPFWNISLSWDERVQDLVSRLTLEEIQLQMARGGAGPYSTPAPPIMRLGDSPD